MELMRQGEDEQQPSGAERDGSQLWELKKTAELKQPVA
jgi:hypothetical protein